MPRLLFEKTGNAVWISHLDLMRLFQRAFKRGGLPLTHTQGFNPRPSVSIALPLSVGASSHCELLDFNLVDANVSHEEICSRLNRSLVDGVRVLQVYDSGRKIGDIALLQCQVTLGYDSPVTDGAVEELQTLFGRNELILPKKTKNGIQQENIIPMIQSLSVSRQDEKHVLLDAVICCQNPTLNPVQLSAAIETFLPDIKPDSTQVTRLEIYDKKMNVFR